MIDCETVWNSKAEKLEDVIKEVEKLVKTIP